MNAKTASKTRKPAAKPTPRAVRDRALKMGGVILAVILKEFDKQSNPGGALFDAAKSTFTVAPTPVPAGSLEWSPTLCEGKRVTHAAAEQACTTLGDGWRLPTVDELQSIVDRARCNPACDQAAFPDMRSGSYWSSTLHAADPACAWIVGFGDGGVGYGPRGDDGAFVRAVRSPRQ